MIERIKELKMLKEHNPATTDTVGLYYNKKTKKQKNKKTKKQKK
jgi:hypothetical protein